MSKKEWHGVFIDEDAIVCDILLKIAESGTEHVWLDEKSYRFPAMRPPFDRNSNRGALWDAGRRIRNYYGLWREGNPYVLCDGDNLIIENGIITDPRFPDNMSGRIMDKVKAKLREQA